MAFALFLARMSLSAAISSRVFGVCVTLAVASTALAAHSESFPDALRAAFGNTIMSTYPDGRQAELWLSANGHYAAKGRRGDDSSGVWQTRRGRLCLRQRRPFPAPWSFCTRIPTRTDQAWSARAVTGERVRVSLLRGHVVGRIGPPR